MWTLAAVVLSSLLTSEISARTLNCAPGYIGQLNKFYNFAYFDLVDAYYEGSLACVTPADYNCKYPPRPSSRV